MVVPMGTTLVVQSGAEWVVLAGMWAASLGLPKGNGKVSSRAKASGFL